MNNRWMWSLPKKKKNRHQGLSKILLKGRTPWNRWSYRLWRCQELPEHLADDPMGCPTPEVSSWNINDRSLPVRALNLKLWFEMRSFQVVVFCPGIVWKWRSAGERHTYGRTRCPYLNMSLSKYIQQNHQKNICKKRKKQTNPFKIT